MAMTKAFLKKIKSEVGATAIEYGLIAASIGIALVALIFLIGGQIQQTFQQILMMISG